MRGEVIKRETVVFCLILVCASVFINVVEAETNITYNETTKTLIFSNPEFKKNSTYKLDGGGFDREPTNTENGRLELTSDSFSFPFKMTIKAIKGDNFSESLTVNPGIITEPTTTTPPPDTTEPLTTTQPGDPGDSSGKKAPPDLTSLLINIAGVILGIAGIIFAVFKLGILSRERDDEPRRLSRVPEAAIQTNYKLKIDLIDGTARIADRIIEITDKDRFPKANGKSDLNGSYTFELPKDTYMINVKGGENYENFSDKIKLSSNKVATITLDKKQYLQVEVVDESGKPISGIYVRVKESGSGMDAPGNSDTDANGIARFTLSRNKKYTVSINSLTQDYTIPGSMEITSSDTSKKFILKRKEGMLEITVKEQVKGQNFPGIPVIAVKKGTNHVLEFVSDSNGMIKQRVTAGEYTIKIKPGASQLYEATEKQVNVSEKSLVPVTLDLRFSYKPSNQTITEIKKHYEKLNTSFKEVSAYDRCIPLFFKSTGERPLKLIERIINRPVEFLGSRTTPDEIISYILGAEEIISEEISRIMREKSNVDFYFSIQNLQQMDELTVSDYSHEKFNELVRDISNYHKNNFREIGNKLHEIDTEITDLSRSLTIQPVADLWRTAQKLQENCNNEPDAKKKGVMLFINDKLLDHVREMYTRDEVKERLKFSML